MSQRGWGLEARLLSFWIVLWRKFTYFQNAQIEAQKTVADIEKRLMAKQSALEKVGL